MPKLYWRMYANPVYDSTSPLYLDLTAQLGSRLTQADFATYSQGGFGEATLVFDDVSAAILHEAWDHWMMKRVVATDSAGYVAYEGYVSEIEATQGSVVDIRSMDPFANRAFVSYQYAGGSCPRGAVCTGRAQRNETNVDANATTQTEWGIKEAWIDVPGNTIVTSTIANQFGDCYLEKVMRPQQPTFTLGSGAELSQNSLRLTLYGYWATLNWRKQSIYTTYAQDIATIISNAMSYSSWSKAQFIAQDTTNLTATGRSIMYNTSKQAMWLQDYILRAMEPGNSSGQTLLFQIWEDRTAYLTVRKQTPTYYSRSNDRKLYDSNHATIPGYMCRAGGFILREDGDESLDQRSDVIARPHRQFIDETQYDALNDILTIPPPEELATPERILARARRKLAKKGEA